jgi:hypothetical protein
MAARPDGSRSRPATRSERPGGANSARQERHWSGPANSSKRRAQAAAARTADLIWIVIEPTIHTLPLT